MRDGKRDYNDPLLWYKQRQDLQNVYQLVRRILCVPATSASVERVFSTAGNICTKKRVRLSPLYLNILTFLKHNRDIVRWGVRGSYDLDGINFGTGMVEEVELALCDDSDSEGDAPAPARKKRLVTTGLEEAV